MNKKYENKILLVDDDSKNLQIAMSILKDYNVIYAQSGEKALELLEKNQFDLILLDVVMPIMNGYEVCSKIKKDEKTKKLGNNPLDYLGYATDSTGKKLSLYYLIKGEWKLYPDLDGWTVKEFPKKDREKIIQLSSIYPIYDWIKDDGYNNFKNWVK